MVSAYQNNQPMNTVQAIVFSNKYFMYFCRFLVLLKNTSSFLSVREDENDIWVSITYYSNQQFLYGYLFDIFSNDLVTWDRNTLIKVDNCKNKKVKCGGIDCSFVVNYPHKEQLHKEVMNWQLVEDRNFNIALIAIWILIHWILRQWFPF